MLPQYEGVVKRKFQKGGRITSTPTGSRRHGSHYASGTPTGLFWKGKGFALAGTGDAVETLSRDKTTGVLQQKKELP
jgi:hypothetical protein